MQLIRFCSRYLKAMWRTLVFGTLFFFVLNVFLICPSVYADVPFTPPHPETTWFDYALMVLVGEGVAWLIGAEFLWRLLRRTEGGQQSSRLTVYGVMLLGMVLSFSIGVIFWKAFGWI